METWSSWPAEVEIESTEEGCVSTLFSETDVCVCVCVWEEGWSDGQGSVCVGRKDVYACEG